MVEISKSGSGEDLGWATGPGYSTANSGRYSTDLRLRTRVFELVSPRVSWPFFVVRAIELHDVRIGRKDRSS